MAEHQDQEQSPNIIGGVWSPQLLVENDDEELVQEPQEPEQGATAAPLSSEVSDQMTLSASAGGHERVPPPTRAFAASISATSHNNNNNNHNRSNNNSKLSQWDHRPSQQGSSYREGTNGGGAPPLPDLLSGSSSMIITGNGGGGASSSHVVPVDEEGSTSSGGGGHLFGASIEGSGGNSWLIQPYIPTDSIPWTTDKERLLGEKNMWFYKNDEVEEEFNRFFFRDQTSLPMAIAYVLGNLSPTISRLATGLTPSVTDIYYLVPMAAILAIAVIVDQVAFFRMDWESHPYKSTIRKVCSILFGYTIVHGSGWYEVWLTAYCWPDAGNYERSCRETLDPYLIIPFATLPFLVKLKLNHQIFLLSVAYFGTIITAGIMHELYFTHGARQGLIFYIFFTVLYIASVTIGYLRFMSVRRQFEQAIEVVVNYNLAIERQVVISTLLESLVPEAVLPRLMDTSEEGEGALAQIDFETEASVLFSDVASFTAWSSSRNAGQVVAMLNTLVTEFDDAAKEAGVERVKTIGDAYWAMCGIPEYNANHAWQLCQFAKEMIAITQQKNQAHPEWKPGSKNNQGIQLRIGIHSGPVTGAILGLKQVAYEVFGETNDVASLIEQNGEPGFVAVSQAVVEHSQHYQLETVGFPYLGGAAKEVENPFYDASLHEPSTTFLSTGDSGDDQSPKSVNEKCIKIWLLPKEADATTFNVERASHFSQQNTPQLLGISRRSSKHSRISRHSQKIGKQNQAEKSRAEMRQKEFLTKLRERRGEILEQEQNADRATGPSLLRTKSSLATTKVTPGGEPSEGGEKEEELTWDQQSRALSTRRFACCCMGYSDEVAEKKFEEFMIEQTRKLRFTARLAQAIISFLMVIFIFIDGRPIGATGLVLYILSFLVAIPPAFICSPAMKCRYPGVDLALALFARFLALAATTISSLSVADPNTTINTVVNRDATTFLWGITLIIGSTYATPVGGSPLIGLLSATIVVPTMVAVWLVGLGQTRADLILIVMASLTCWVYLVITERVYRTTYFQHQRALFLAKEREENIRSTEDILQKLVPEHVTKGLMRWISAGMAAEESIARDYERACVGFILLKDPIYSAALKTPQSHSMGVVDANSQRQHSGGGALALLNTNNDSPLPNSSALGGGSSSTRTETLLTKSFMSLSASARNGNAEALNGIKEAGLWLKGAHRKIDAFLGEVYGNSSGSLTKIKSIGDLVMIAGPFREIDLEDHQGGENEEQQGGGGKLEQKTVTSQPKRLRRAAKDLLEFSLSINSQLKIPVVAGMHVGPVMTAVLGTNRPTFDVFGDTVNVASRVLSAAKQDPLAAVGCSAAFVNLLSKTPQLRRRDHRGGSSCENTSFSSTSTMEHSAADSASDSAGPVGLAAEETSAPSTATAALSALTVALPSSLKSTASDPLTKRQQSSSSIVQLAPDLPCSIAGVQFSAEQEVAAKGKGTIRIRKINRSLPSIVGGEGV